MKKAFCRQCGVLLAISEIEKGICNSCLSEIPVANKAESQQQTPSELYQAPVAQSYQPAQPNMTAEFNKGQNPDISWRKPVIIGLGMLFVVLIIYTALAAWLVINAAMAKNGISIKASNVIIGLMLNNSRFDRSMIITGLVFGLLMLICWILIFIACILLTSVPKKVRMYANIVLAGLIIAFLFSLINGVISGFSLKDDVIETRTEVTMDHFGNMRLQEVETNKSIKQRENLSMVSFIFSILNSFLHITIFVSFLYFLRDLCSYIQKSRLSTFISVYTWIPVIVYIFLTLVAMVMDPRSSLFKKENSMFWVVVLCGIILAVLAVASWILLLSFIWMVRNAVAKWRIPVATTFKHA